MPVSTGLMRFNYFDKLTEKGYYKGDITVVTIASETSGTKKTLARYKVVPSSLFKGGTSTARHLEAKAGQKLDYIVSGAYRLASVVMALFTLIGLTLKSLYHLGAGFCNFCATCGKNPASFRPLVADLVDASILFEIIIKGSVQSTLELAFSLPHKAVTAWRDGINQNKFVKEIQLSTKREQFLQLSRENVAKLINQQLTIALEKLDKDDGEGQSKLEMEAARVIHSVQSFSPDLTSGPKRAALLAIDIQNSFIEEGTADGITYAKGELGVMGGCETIPVTNMLLDKITGLKVASKDSHEKEHASFAANIGEKPLTLVELQVEGDRLVQVAWPAHCIQGTHGEKFAQGLKASKLDATVYKGQGTRDSYSAFCDVRAEGVASNIPNQEAEAETKSGSERTKIAYGNKKLDRNLHKKGMTNLDQTLTRNGITDVFFTGLAYDYCVGESAIDAAALGYQPTIVLDGTKWIAFPSMLAMTERLAAAGCLFATSEQLANGTAYGSEFFGYDPEGSHEEQGVAQ